MGTARHLAIVCLAALALVSSATSAAAASDVKYITNPPAMRGPLISAVAGTRSVEPRCLLAAPGFACYGPAELKAAYGFPSHLDGTGQTIMVVEAFGSATIRSDLVAFDEFFGIPEPASFTIFCPQGCAQDGTATQREMFAWALETSLDIEYAHAMAPGADLVLVVAASASGNAINAAEAAAIRKYPGAVISQSFGVPEAYINGGANNTQVRQAHENYVLAEARGDTVIAAAGDLGATNGFATANAQYPASDPAVLAVGGTQGLPYPGGLYDAKRERYGGEQVWNEQDFGLATGGAASALFPTPPWQSQLQTTGFRTIPDVSYNAALNGGVQVFASPSVWVVGGTSAGAPQWAAIVAIANQARARLGRTPVGLVAPRLYALASSSSYHDITVGTNALGAGPGFSAHAGYDLATGLGTPNVAALVDGLNR
jgi:subtilase family serine protease